MRFRNYEYMNVLLFIISISYSIGCTNKSAVSDQSEDDSIITDSDDDTKKQCGQLSHEECVKFAHCNAQYGEKFDPNTNCLQKEFAACEKKTTDKTCGSAITRASDSNGECWLFYDTCIPKTFTDTGCYIPGVKTCKEIQNAKECIYQYEDCVSDTRCFAIIGRIYEEKSDCFSSHGTYLGCRSKSDNCVTSSVTAARDDTTCFLLENKNSCIPKGDNWKAQDCHVDAKVCEF